MCSIYELETHNNINKIRDLCKSISDFMKGYQPRTNIVKDDKGDLVADCHSILDRWSKFFCHLLNVHGVNDVKQTEIHTAELLVPESSASEFQLAIKKLKRHKSPGIDKIAAEFIKTIRCEFHKLIISIWNKEELPEEWKKSIMVLIYMKGDEIDCSNCRGISILPTIYKLLSSILFSRLPPNAEEIIGDYQCEF